MHAFLHVLSRYFNYADLGEHAGRDGQVRKWSAASALQTLKVSGDSEEVVYKVVRFPWTHPNLLTNPNCEFFNDELCCILLFYFME